MECFETEGYQSDNLGGHNIDAKALSAAGLCDTELLESIFEVEIGNTKEEIHNNLLKVGFQFSPEFDKFIKH